MLQIFSIGSANSGDQDKDFIHDNMKRVRQASSQAKVAKGAPMKVKFIPGVTKNPKFEHVESRVAGLIRVSKEMRKVNLLAIKSLTHFTH